MRRLRVKRENYSKYGLMFVNQHHERGITSNRYKSLAVNGKKVLYILSIKSRKDVTIEGYEIVVANFD